MKQILLKSTLAVFALILAGCETTKSIVVQEKKNDSVRYEDGVAVLKSEKKHAVVVRLLDLLPINRAI